MSPSDLPPSPTARASRSKLICAVSRCDSAPATKPILEINPKHPVVERLKGEERHFDDWANVLFDQAVLAEGGQLDDPAGFVRRVNQLMLELDAGRSSASA